MKKFSLLSNDAVRNHLANKSPAKVTHAFPRSKRFGKDNPEYTIIYPDVKRPSTIHLPPSLLFPSARVVSASAKNLTSPSTPSSLQDLPDISIEVSLIKWVRHTVFQSEGKRVPADTIPITYQKKKFQAQEHIKIRSPL